MSKNKKLQKKSVIINTAKNKSSLEWLLFQHNYERDNFYIPNKMVTTKTLIKRLHPLLWDNQISRFLETFVDTTIAYGQVRSSMQEIIRSVCRDGVLEEMLQPTSNGPCCETILLTKSTYRKKCNECNFFLNGLKANLHSVGKEKGLENTGILE